MLDFSQFCTRLSFVFLYSLLLDIPQIEPLEKAKILVLDSNSDMSNIDEILEDLNGRNSSVWFRLINIQPR